MIQILTKEQSYSSSDLWQWIESYRQALPKSERILIALKDPVHQLAALYAGLLEGRTVLSANSNASPSEFKQTLELFKPHEIFTELQVTPLAATVRELNPNKGLIGIATSGSSGRPKIVLHRPSSLIAAANSYNSFYQVTSDDVLSSPLPLHHIGGIMPFWRCLKSGATLVLAKGSWTDVLHFQSDHISLVPTQLLQLLEQKYIWRSYKCVLLGAQALDPNLFARAIAENIPISVSYGSSESAAVLSATIPGTDPEGGVGVPLPGRDVVIIDDKIAFKGDACFHAYQEGTVISHPFNQDGYFVTQDMGRFDEQGRLYILGRADHIFKCGGENVNPVQVERKIQQEIQLDDIMVLPIVDDVYGQLPAAFIRPFTPSLFNQIKQLNRSMPPHQRIRYLSSEIPATSGIKISRSYAAEKMRLSFSKWSLMRLGTKQRQKPDLIFLHGFMGTKSSLHELAGHFSTDFNVWGLDLPFHGSNDGSNIHLWDDVIDQLAALLIRFQAPWLYGYSMGGRIALGLAQRHPESFQHLILEGVHPGLKSEDERLARQHEEQALTQRMTNDFAQFLTDWYKAPLFSLNDQLISRLIQDTPSTVSHYAKALAVYGLSQQPDFSEIITRVNPIILVGANDKKFCALHPRALAIANCGHKASFQAPELVFKTVRDEIARRNWRP